MSNLAFLKRLFSVQGFILKLIYLLEQVFNFHCHITCDIVYVCVYSCTEILLLIKFRIYKIHYVMSPPLRNYVEFLLVFVGDEGNGCCLARIT